MKVTSCVNSRCYFFSCFLVNFVGKDYVFIKKIVVILKDLQKIFVGGLCMKEIRWGSPISFACAGVFLFGLATLLDTIWKYFLSFG